MIKTLRYYPEILDLWALPSRWLKKLAHFTLVFAAHAFLFKMVAQMGPQEPYSSYKETVLSNQQKQIKKYDFSRLGKTFIPWESYRLEEIDAETLKKLIIKSVPKPLRPKVSKYVAQTLDICEHYKLDPFWVLSIMWTESHFNTNAISKVKANGLMQIMPGTAHYLLKSMNRPVSPKIAFEIVKDSNMNIKMGTFYLRKLFINFNFNFKYATIAYNMGHNGVMRRLRRGQVVGDNHDYLKKVQKHYIKLIKPVRAYLNSIAAPYTKTLVAQKKWQVKQKRVFTFNDFKEIDLFALSNISSQRLEL